MKLNYFRKISGVLLLGFIFLINTLPTQAAFVCPAGMDPGTCAELQATQGAIDVKCENITSPDQCVGNCLWSNNKCQSQGTPVYTSCADGNNSQNICQTIVGCSWDSQNKKCALSQAIQQTDIGGLKKVIPAYVPRVEIPCNTTIAGGACPTNWKTDLGSYIGRVYQFGLMIVGFVAFGMIIYGAAEYTLSAGGVTKKEDAKAKIMNAVYGVILLFGAYLILYTINPKLVQLGNFQVEPIDLSQYTPQSTYVTSDNNTLTENTGTSGIPGCLVTVSETGGLLGTGLQVGVTVTSDQGTQQYGTGGATKMLCTKCSEGYTLKDGACVASYGVCARGADSSGKCCPVGTAAVSSGYDTILKKDKMVCVAPCPVGTTYDTNAQCTICTSGYAKLSGKCVKTITSGVCPSGLAATTGECIPK